MYLDEAVGRLEAGDFPYSDANAKKIRGSARKCQKLPAYNCPLSMIPVDAEAFVRRWATNIANRDAPEGFKTFSRFSTWHSNVKSLMEHASGRRAERDRLRGQSDDWSQLQDQAAGLIRMRRAGHKIQTLDLIALTVLATVGREKGAQPRGLTVAALHLWIQDCLDRGRKASIRKAAKLIDQLHAYPEDVDPMLLPPPLGDIPKASRHRVTPELPRPVTQAIRGYQRMLREGRPYEGLLAGRRREGLSETTLKGIGDELRWFFTGLTELDRLPVGAAIEDLATAENIFAVFDAEIAEEFPWKPLAPRTLKKNLSTSFRFARQYRPELFEVQTEFFKTEFFSNWDTMTEANQAFCRRLVQSQSRMATFLNLARLLQQQAAPLIADFESLPEGQKGRAVKLALAAASAAVLTFLPLRATTLTRLDVVGQQAQITLPATSKGVHFAIPKGLIKNKKPLTAVISRRGKTDPRAILDWWLAEARPHLMPRLRQPDQRLLLGGANYSYLSEAWRFATASVDHYMTLHQVRHSIASILINQPDADLHVIAALLNNTPSTVARTYAFFDQEAAFARGQVGLDKVNKALEGRMAR
ncbi:hypothetical protein SAMN04488567_0976 [Limimaricola pyoseonensis]|uniref:Phage integrase family protein n=2 Tax=Limimaricola pyoseonensis TaxID=521013 RepID=A0A1G7AIA2_9RHOB|nr:hypothetical protein SAMN04488567_0976 [Limimaricola pyoseonensis]